MERLPLVCRFPTSPTPESCVPVALIALGALIGVLATWLIIHRRLDASIAQCRSERQGRMGEHARAEAANADAHRLRAALDALDVGVVLTDRLAGVVLHNASLERIVGSRYGEALIGEAVEHLLVENQMDRVARRTVVLQGPPPRTLQLQAVPLADDPGGWLVTITDVTERTRLDAVRTDFVANIGHELKTPVGAMSLLAETLADVDDFPTVRRLASKVVREATRLARTVDDLLELSRIELGGEPVRDVVALRRVVEDSVERVSQLAELRGVRLVVDHSVADTRLVGDRRQLVSAVANLLDNAVKYSADGDAVTVGATTDGQWVDIVVADRGMGIGQQHLERIFERFYRVDRARSRDTGGTGLGLAIVRHVAVNHGGEIFVQSEEGQGSTFTLRVPADGHVEPEER